MTYIVIDDRHVAISMAIFFGESLNCRLSYVSNEEKMNKNVDGEGGIW